MRCNQNEMKLEIAPTFHNENYFTPGARPAPATAAASRSQASSPALPRSLRRSTSRVPLGHCGSAAATAARTSKRLQIFQGKISSF